MNATVINVRETFTKPIIVAQSRPSQIIRAHAAKVALLMQAIAALKMSLADYESELVRIQLLCKKN